MEDIMNVLRNIQKDLEEQKTTIRQSGHSITDQVTLNINKILEDKFSIWEEKQNILREKVENQEKRIYFLEKQARKRNIVFFEIEENETSYENLEKSILQWLDMYLSIKLEQRDIQEVKRVGKKGGIPRPIIATFSTLGLKINIFEQKRMLKDTPFYMKEDYPLYVLEKRKELQEQVKLEAEKGNKAIIKYDKLIILKKKTIREHFPTHLKIAVKSKATKIYKLLKIIKHLNNILSSISTSKAGNAPVAPLVLHGVVGGGDHHQVTRTLVCLVLFP